MTSIEVITVDGKTWRPTPFDCIVASQYEERFLVRYYRIIRLLMLAGFCLLFLTGCATRDELASLKQSLRTTETRCEENTTALAAIKSQQKAIELPESPIGTEVISSETEPQTVQDGNGSQTTNSQPETTAAVRLFVTYSTGYCPPCNVLKKAIERGDLAGFEIKPCGDFYGIRSYPAIRWDDPASPSGKKVLYGWSDSYAAWLRKTLLPGTDRELSGNYEKTQGKTGNSFSSTTMSHSEMKALHDSLHGGGFSWTWPGGTTESLAEHLRTTHGVPNVLDQNYRASTILTSRTVVRTSPRGIFGSWRSRNTYRQSCPSCR